MNIYLRESNLLVRLAYWGDIIPRHSNVCVLFWRVVLQVFCRLAIVLLGAGIVFVVGMNLLELLIQHWRMALIGLAGLAVVATLIAWLSRRVDLESIADSGLADHARQAKDTICPRIYFR